MAAMFHQWSYKDKEWTSEEENDEHGTGCQCVELLAC